MAIPSKQIGWSQESNLLWEIAKQVDMLTKVVASSTPTPFSLPYKSYTAIYTQQGVTPGNPPTLVNVLENTITPGNTPIIAYYNPGIYNITFNDTVLTLNKTFIMCNAWGDDQSSPVPSSGFISNDETIAWFGNPLGYDANNFIYVEVRVYN